MTAIPRIINTNTTDYAAQPPPVLKCRYTLYAIGIISLVAGILLNLAVRRLLPGCDSLSAHQINIMNKLDMWIITFTPLFLTFPCYFNLTSRQELHHAPHLRHRVMHRCSALLDRDSPEKHALKKGRPELLKHYLSEKGLSENVTKESLITALKKYSDSLPDPKNEQTWYRPITRWFDENIEASPAARFECIKVILQERSQQTADVNQSKELTYLLKRFKQHPIERTALLRLFLENKTNIENLMRVAVETDDVLAIEQINTVQPDLKISNRTILDAIQRVLDGDNKSTDMIKVLLSFAKEKAQHPNCLIIGVLDKSGNLVERKQMTLVFIEQGKTDIRTVYGLCILNEFIEGIKILHDVALEQLESKPHILHAVVESDDCLDKITAWLPYATITEIRNCLALDNVTDKPKITALLKARQQALSLQTA